MKNEIKNYAVEFQGYDGKIRKTLPMTKLGATLACCLISFSSAYDPARSPKVIVLGRRDKKNK